MWQCGPTPKTIFVLYVCPYVRLSVAVDCCDGSQCARWCCRVFLCWRTTLFGTFRKTAHWWKHWTSVVVFNWPIAGKTSSVTFADPNTKIRGHVSIESTTWYKRVLCLGDVLCWPCMNVPSVTHRFPMILSSTTDCSFYIVLDNYMIENEFQLFKHFIITGCAKMGVEEYQVSVVWRRSGE